MVCAWTGLIRFRIRTSGGILWTRQWIFEFRKIWVYYWLAEELSVVEGLCCVQLAAMYGCGIRVQLHIGQQFSLSAECEPNAHCAIQNNGGCSGQNVHPAMQHKAPTATVGFTYRYTLLSESIAASPLRKLTLPRFAFWQARSHSGEKWLLVSSCLSVRRPSVYNELGSHWTDFHEILYMRAFRKTAEKIRGFTKI